MPKFIRRASTSAVIRARQKGCQRGRGRSLFSLDELDELVIRGVVLRDDQPFHREASEGPWLVGVGGDVMNQRNVAAIGRVPGGWQI